ncbi:XRE family transcriptional regulator [Herbaspirillum rubrisubalbicans Os34]|uniref:XRE family transcriptional regulator n=1 Tax=Herbaspirillum rubrisubalbicans Os34 TaxID=1235827 RepID=A0A6M3ZL37_9BURK|nr:helix-turn-helix transcriptional regulator [Herbaspirillum rubrisubalbicans]QJP98679.1 XRE family transcriptional regulator [Herbaspirillum rubrisubalbicans Os34]
MNLDFKLAMPSEICGELDGRLRAARLDKGWQQEEVALRAGISRNTLLALETHGRGSISTLIRVATVLSFTEQLQSLFVVDKILSIKPLEVMHAAKTRQRVRKPSSKER